ncbi:MAG: NAD(P)-dependent glycerol-3-phosphate dehydrogenase [Bauldia sp.]|nr:NAD(P)-dependent glycerol-3-phosphate dehydrogenase [Bauldia sp.]
MIDTIGVIGGGAWGTALALTATRAGRGTLLWARDPLTVAEINSRHENPRHLPGIPLGGALKATGSLAEAARADALILAVPAQEIRHVATSLATDIRDGQPVIVAAKGLERGTGKRLSEILAAILPDAIPAILSGPSFAVDVARGLPTAVTIASADEALALDLCRALGSASFRPYAETDVTGVELGGAFKNVLAIAAGVVAGRGLGASASAAIVARGFAEMRRLGEAVGARPETLMGLSGLGDLVLTCSSTQSRNYSFGIQLGSGGGRDPGLTVVEGIATASTARDLARFLGIPMPITEAVAGVVDGALGVGEAIESLMTRPLRKESD